MRAASGHFRANSALNVQPLDVLEAGSIGGDSLAHVSREPAGHQSTSHRSTGEGGPTFTVWSSEAVATRARGPPKPQCRSVMGRVWRDQTCRGHGVLERSAWSTLWEQRAQGGPCLVPHLPPHGHRARPPKGSSGMLPHGPQHGPIALVRLTPALGLWHGLLQSRLPALPSDRLQTACGTAWRELQGSRRYLHRLHTSTRQSLPPDRKWLLSPVNCRQETSW